MFWEDQIVAACNNEVKIWDVVTKMQGKTFKSEGIEKVLISNDGQQLNTLAQDGTLSRKVTGSLTEISLDVLSPHSGVDMSGDIMALIDGEEIKLYENANLKWTAK